MRIKRLLLRWYGASHDGPVASPAQHQGTIDAILFTVPTTTTTTPLHAF